MLNHRQLALVHIAKSQLALSDQEYLDTLSAVCKREIKSSKEINSLVELNAIIDAFKALGFKPSKTFKAFSRKQRIADKTISKEQIELIEALWQKVTKHPNIWRQALNNFLAMRFSALDVKALSGMKAINVIEALKDMALKTALVEVNIAMGYGETVVQNRLLENFKSVKMCFDQDELAAVLAVLFYSQPQLYERCKTAAAQFQSKMSTKQPTEEEIPF